MTKKTFPKTKLFIDINTSGIRTASENTISAKIAKSLFFILYKLINIIR